MAEIRPLKRCRYCAQEIDPLAKVCHHCSRAQSRFFNFVNNSDLLASLISLGVLIVSIYQLSEATEASAKAKEALEKVTATEVRVSQARRDVLDIAQAVIEIAEILPRTGGYGGGLTEKDTELLKKQLDFLRTKLNRAKDNALFQ